MKRKPKPAAPARVYPAEKDPRQQYIGDDLLVDGHGIVVGLDFRSTLYLVCDTASLAREFGPWVRDGEGRWVRR